MPRDKRIDQKIAKAAPFARPILTHLRELVHETIPDAGEAIKWGMPHFTWQGKNIAGMAAFKAHCAFMIGGEGRQGAGMGNFGKLTSLKDLPSKKELKAKLLAARERIESAGRASKPRPRSKPKAAANVPQDFAAMLQANEATQKVFDGFTDAQRRDYVEWITGAKQDATRERRLAQAVEWIAEGKRRNWKYER